jgi:hypothetical protein
MTDPFHPKNDPAVRNLKLIATRGGDRGPLYDRGVLDTIGSAEEYGCLQKNQEARLLMALGIHVQSKVQFITDEEELAARSHLKLRGWTLDEGIEYGSGVMFAEWILSHHLTADKK